MMRSKVTVFFPLLLVDGEVLRLACINRAAERAGGVNTPRA
ncbi:hypothetical protein SCD90_02225 [Terrihabitans sp. PJ23]|uniref:Uncharacterized protein n=1 Tax=Terrihabitans rhizophilus TaxID=3092662 RepID=A0ABU4RMI4_9HYPH|nr:hypothetical protein [Terrihabitans sp. PJ23]